MPKITVRFHRCVQDTQEYGSDDEHMLSRVDFSLLVDGVPRGEFSAQVKQPVGSDFESSGLEVGPPTGYSGPFNHEAFSSAVEVYYRTHVGRVGKAIRVEGASRVTTRMRNNVFLAEVEVTFDTSGKIEEVR